MRTVRRCCVTMLSAALVFTAAVEAAPGRGHGNGRGRGNPNPGVLPPHSRAYGKTLAEWGSEWWQWAVNIPAEMNPVLDDTGEFCDVDQSGPVWFLAGTFGGTAVRECTIPAGKAVLFPLVNSFFINCPDENFTAEEMMDALDERYALTCELHCTIDGVPLRDLEIYRAQIADAWTLTEENIIGCGEPLPAGDYEPVVSDGFWILHTPFSPGEHEINFGGAFCDPETGEAFFEVDVTYFLTVVP